jgi:hypothetical protein
MYKLMEAGKGGNDQVFAYNCTSVRMEVQVTLCAQHSKKLVYIKYIAKEGPVRIQY